MSNAENFTLTAAVCSWRAQTCKIIFTDIWDGMFGNSSASLHQMLQNQLFIYRRFILVVTLNIQIKGPVGNIFRDLVSGKYVTVL